MRRKLLTLALAAGGIGLAGWSAWAQEPSTPRPSAPAAREVQGQPPPRGDRPGRGDPDQPPPRPRDDEPRRGRGDDDGPRRPRDDDFRRPMNAPRPEGPGVLMYATEKFVYVLRGDELLQFDANGLNLMKKVRLPAPERPDRDGERRAPRD